MSHLPGLPLVPALAMGIGAMTAAVLKLPLTSVLLASLLLLSDAAKLMPLVIVAVVERDAARALACLAAFNPKLLAVDLIFMGNSRPLLTFACFLLSGMSLASGLARLL